MIKGGGAAKGIPKKINFVRGKVGGKPKKTPKGVFPKLHNKKRMGGEQARNLLKKKFFSPKKKRGGSSHHLTNFFLKGGKEFLKKGALKPKEIV